jgi:drug/metabolite transporter (DMT)-like permease
MTEAGRTGEGSGLTPALAAVVIWGLVPVGTRFFVETTNPLAFNVVRFGVSGLFALPLLVKAAPWRWPAGDLLRLLAGAVLAIPAYNIPVAIAAKSVPAGTMGLLIATEPVFILLFSLLLRGSGVRLSAGLGAALAFAGVLMTTSGGGAGAAATDPAGAGLVLAGSACWALYSVLTAPLVIRHGAGAVAGSILVFGGAALCAVSVPAVPPGAWPGPLVTVELALMGLMSALVAFLFWTKAAEVLPMSRLGLFLYLIPVVSLLVGAALLGERPTLASVSGGALILLGVAVGEGRAGALVRRVFAPARP